MTSSCVQCYEKKKSLNYLYSKSAIMFDRWITEYYDLFFAIMNGENILYPYHLEIDEEEIIVSFTVETSQSRIIESSLKRIFYATGIEISVDRAYSI